MQEHAFNEIFELYTQTKRKSHVAGKCKLAKKWTVLLQILDNVLGHRESLLRVMLNAQLALYGTT